MLDQTTPIKPRHGEAANGGAPSATKIRQSVLEVARRFPLEGYMCQPYEAHENVARTVVSYVPRGGRVLDFGAGPCDKLAVLAQLGYACTAYDDLGDPWHDGKRDIILKYAAEHGIAYCLPGDGQPWRQQQFDIIMLHDVLEHLHDSPRELLVDLAQAVRPGGYLFVTVPNAVNIRKRIAVALGRTNHPPYQQYWWSSSPWRGHVREYTRGDLDCLSSNLGLKPAELRGCHHMIQNVPSRFRPAYRMVTRVFPGWCDSWLLMAKKPGSWSRQWAEQAPDRVSDDGAGSPWH